MIVFNELNAYLARKLLNMSATDCHTDLGCCRVLVAKKTKKTIHLAASCEGWALLCTIHKERTAPGKLRVLEKEIYPCRNVSSVLCWSFKLVPCIPHCKIICRTTW